MVPRARHSLAGALGGRVRVMRSRMGDSVLAALVSWIIPFTYLVFSGPTYDTAGNPDNPPYWAKGALIFLTPLILILLTLYYYAMPVLLSWFRFKSLWS